MMEVPLPRPYSWFVSYRRALIHVVIGTVGFLTVGLIGPVAVAAPATSVEVLASPSNPLLLDLAQNSTPANDEASPSQRHPLRKSDSKPAPLPAPKPVKPNPPPTAPAKPPIPRYPVPQPREVEVETTPPLPTPPPPTTPPSQEPEERTPAEPPPSLPPEKPSIQLPDSRSNRAVQNWTGLASWSPLDMWIPSKWGLSAVYVASPATSFEFEYLRGTLGVGFFGKDLGEIREERYTAMVRRYGRRNSFNYFAGFNYTRLQSHLGEKFLSTLAGSERTFANVVDFASMGLSLGLGNRWQFKNGLTFGADWLAINIPLWLVKEDTPFLDLTSSTERAEDVRDWLRIVRRIPALATLKLQVGFSF
ncbi:MAG: hypothetical protein AB7G93_12935 [Bdellovibrionales bacterium]